MAETKIEEQQSLEDKEQFTSQMSDDELKNQIDAWTRESQSVYSALIPIWEQNLLYYHGIQTEVERITGRQSRAVENRIFMATETMVPIATSRLPDIEVRSGDEDEQSQIDAGELQDIIGFHMERLKMQALAERFLRYMIILRYGVFKIDWNKDKDDVGLIVVDPRRVRIPKFGRTTHELKYILEDLELTYDQLVNFFGKDKAEKVRAEGPKKAVHFDDVSGKLTRTDIQGNIQGQQIRRATFAVTEIWTNETVVWRAGSIILDKKENPFFDFNNKKRNFFETPQKPYVIKSLFHTTESLIGDTDYIQQMISVQDNVNTRKRQIENIIAKVANPPLLIDSDVMSEEQAANITNEEGLIIYGKDAAAGTKIRFETPGQVPNYMFLDLEGSRTQFDNIWGIHSTTRGEREGRETLGGRQLLRAADLGRIDLIARQLERALDEIAEYWTQLIKLFYTEKKSFSISGEDGTRFIQNFTGKKVGRGVKPRVVAGSTLPKDEITQRQEAIQLWQLGAIGIRTLYKRLKMSNVADAVDDFIQTKSGAIFRQAQGGGQPPAGGGALPEQGAVQPGVQQQV